MDTSPATPKSRKEADITLQNIDEFVEFFAIDPEVVKSGDVEMLQDLVMAAVNEALTKVQAEYLGVELEGPYKPSHYRY